MFNAPVDVGTLPLTEPEIYGTVTAPDGVSPVPAEVRVTLGGGTVAQWLATTFGRPHGEWGYFGVKPRLYVERMILDGDNGYCTTEAKVYVYCGIVGRIDELGGVEIHPFNFFAFVSNWYFLPKEELGF